VNRRALRRDAARELRATGQRALGEMPRRRQWALRLHGAWRRSVVPGPPRWLTSYGPDYANGVYEDAITRAEKAMPRRYRRAFAGDAMAPSVKPSPSDRT
jgi:hypothetical protein